MPSGPGSVMHRSARPVQIRNPRDDRRNAYLQAD
jgi:hypothetical protein